HRIKGDDARDVGHRHVHPLGGVFDVLVRDVSPLRLDQVKDRQKSRLRPRILQQGGLDPAFGLLARNHRSTSPMTGSRLATTAIRSETIPPSAMSGTACRL